MSSQETSHKAGELAGQAQMKKDEMISQASDASQATSQSLKGTKDQAGGFIQQTGEKMMNMAHGAADTVKNTTHGAADAVKNTLGMGSDRN